MLAKHCEIKTYWIAFAIGILIFIFELTGSFFSGSVALLADTFHVLGDSLGHLLAILVAYISIRKPHLERRSRSVGGLLSGGLLLIASVIIAKEASERIFNPVIIKGGLLLVFAFLGAAGNGAVLWLVHSRTEPNITKSVLMRHIAIDLSQSVIVIISAIIVIGKPEWFLIDPVLSLILAAVTFLLSIKTFRESRNFS